MTTHKAFVLLSGGLDSTTCLYKAIYDYAPKDLPIYEYYKSMKGFLGDCEPGFEIEWVEAVSIDYGQRHKKEMEYAQATCRRLGIQHVSLPLGDLLRSPNTMLTERDIEIPNVDYADLPHGVSPTYVPYRNGMMLSVLAAHAQKWINEANKQFSSPPERELPSAGIYFGAHSEDAHNWAYPDCTPEFIGAQANAIHVGTYYQVRLHTPLMSLTKAEIVELGDKLGVPFESTWSCYKGEELHCGVCPTCRSRRNAFDAAGIHDPTQYADEEGC